MLKTNPRFLILLNLLAGLCGGVLASFCILGSSVVAQPIPADTPNMMKADIPQTISAQECRLVDTNGKTRALLGFSADGQPILHLMDESESARVLLGIAADTGVKVHDVDGRTRLVLSVDEQGQPSLVMRNQQFLTKSFHP